jgi:hypothetical protein
MGRARKRSVQRQQLPEHVRAFDHREPSMLATSEATLKAMEKKRGTPLIVPNTVKMFGMHKLSIAEMEALLIDTRYQRDEVTTEVNDLIVVLKKGGQIPDPISVAERKYGDRGRYIVDGQQRWWAHIDTSTPIYAVIYQVNSFEDEVALFHALNLQTRVSPETRLRSLPGPAGTTLRRLNEDSKSPLYGQVSFMDKGSTRFGAMIVVRGLAALLSNTKMGGGLDRVTPTFDRYYAMNPKAAERLIDSYAWLIAQIFEKRRMRSVAAVALARMVYATFANQGEMPTPKQLTRLKAMDFDKLTPTHSMQWLPTVVAAVQEIWPVQMVQETK